MIEKKQYLSRNMNIKKNELNDIIVVNVIKTKKKILITTGKKNHKIKT